LPQCSIAVYSNLIIISKITGKALNLCAIQVAPKHHPLFIFFRSNFIAVLVADRPGPFALLVGAEGGGLSAAALCVGTVFAGAYALGGRTSTVEAS